MFITWAVSNKYVLVTSTELSTCDHRILNNHEDNPIITMAPISTAKPTMKHSTIIPTKSPNPIVSANNMSGGIPNLPSTALFIMAVTIPCFCVFVICVYCIFFRKKKSDRKITLNDHHSNVGVDHSRIYCDAHMSPSAPQLPSYMNFYQQHDALINLPYINENNGFSNNNFDTPVAIPIHPRNSILQNNRNSASTPVAIATPILM